MSDADFYFFCWIVVIFGKCWNIFLFRGKKKYQCTRISMVMWIKWFEMYTFFTKAAFFRNIKVFKLFRRCDDHQKMRKKLIQISNLMFEEKRKAHNIHTLHALHAFTSVHDSGFCWLEWTEINWPKKSDYNFHISIEYDMQTI